MDSRDETSETTSFSPEHRRLPSSRFKGVVPQPNGRWGAQIYEKHQRVWLGTFLEEEEAGKAYDVAALRFRGRGAVRNFQPPLAADENEAAFLNSRSKSEIVDMLRKHTYKAELEQSRRSGSNRLVELDRSFTLELLFEKTVTPSDVGKLNRLVIPKQHAEKYFPAQTGGSTMGVLMNFEDRTGKVWRFRYSYWNSSQSYVLTKGWSRFVKEKSLSPGAIVRFERSMSEEKQLYIDCRPGPGRGPEPGSHFRPVHMVRLFGVNIFQVPVDSVKLVVEKNGAWKRKRVHEFNLECENNTSLVGAM